MKIKNIDVIMQNKVFAWIAVGTTLLLMMPFLLMKLKIPLYDPGSDYEVIKWSLYDFVLMGVLIFVTSSLFVIVIRKVPKKSHRIALALAFLLGFLWLWAELAVGVFIANIPG